jgi:hypothetical protein
MPYINQDIRAKLDDTIDFLALKIVEESKSDTDFGGILNYSVSRLVAKILISKFDRLRYWHSPMIRGVLMDVADEFYRRIMIPYEDKQIDVNGDVDLFKELIRK